MLRVTLTAKATKLAIRFFSDSQITEALIFQDASGNHFIQSPTVSVPLDYEGHPQHIAFDGVMIRHTQLVAISHNLRTARKTAVILTQRGQTVGIQYV